MATLPTVTLYGRAGCHLCDEARELLLQLRQEGASFELEEIDIETDEGLHSRYLERIPVIAVDGTIASELVPDPVAVRSRLDRLPR
ncbi:MAG: hypothetical protein QOG09_1447 [Solirubrobacterales bacterium]|nr:hypothetical protein [Solirubrobacterales bacterium]